VKREFLVAVAGAAVVVAGLSGCSSNDKNSESPATSGEATTDAGTASATAAPSGEAGTRSATAAPSVAGARVSIDGQAQTLSGAVACNAMGGNMNIAIGEGATGIAAVVSSGDSPTVQSVGLGNVNGVTLGYQSGTGQGEAKAEKDGNTYKISGIATGVDMANPMQLVNKPFEIKVICP
jgi:ipoprotein LpqH